MSLNDRIKLAEEKTDTNPTTRQKESGNYKKGKVVVKGLNISIENPVGSIRSGKDDDGKEWKIKMPYSYGYINRTNGKDGEQIDVYLSGDLETDFDVFIIDQICAKTKAFDEHKVMFGFPDKESAKQAYLSCYESGWQGFGNITKLSFVNFKKWLNDKRMTNIPASKIQPNFKNVAENEDDKICAIELFGEVIADETLKNLQEQAEKFGDFNTLVVEIASQGGSVEEGLKIMVWLNELSKSGVQVVTLVVANSYSIASLIMLVADVRLISKHGEVMVHNPMLPELKFANANDLEKYVDELRGLESYMYQLYEMFTGLSKQEIKALMDNETYLKPEDAVIKGFADMVVDVKPKEYEMGNKKKEINMKNTINSLNKIIALVNKSDVVNQFYYDENGEEFDVYQNDPAQVTIGDKTSVKEGKKILADGTIITIEDYKITDIDKSNSPEEIEQVAESDESVEEPAVEQEVVEEIAVEEPAVEVAEPESVEVSEPEPNVVSKEEFDSLKMKYDEMESRYKDLESLVNKKIEDVESKMVGFTQFESKATEAIDTIASNLSTDFSPQASANSSVDEGDSIFQAILQKRKQK